MINISDHNFRQAYLDNLLKGNRAGCSSQIKKYREQNPSVIDLYEDMIKSSLYKVGTMWENNQISVAAEHVATAVTEALLNELLDSILPARRYSRKMIATCVENEQHQVGIKMVADVFEMNGWDSIFVGKGIPVKELISLIDKEKPDLIAISLSVYFNVSSLLNTIKEINQKFPGLQILLGGQAFRYIPSIQFAVIKNTTVITDLYLLDKHIKDYKSLVSG